MQNAADGGNIKKWYARRDLNPRPSDPESDALSTELRARVQYYASKRRETQARFRP